MFLVDGDVLEVGLRIAPYTFIVATVLERLSDSRHLVSPLRPRCRSQPGDNYLTREALYQAARERHPQRWSGATRGWTPTDAVTLDPDRCGDRAIRPAA